MKRRDTLRTIVAGSVGSALILKGCVTETDAVEQNKQPSTAGYGRTPEETERDRELMEEQFFNAHEMATLAALCDIIIPADAVSGSATDAGVPDFIEFIVKDIPQYQLPMRGGLMWLDHQCLEEYGTSFKDSTPEHQIEIAERISDARTVAPGDEAGVKFFALARDLTATGFFTSEMGIKDLGYKGNVPNFWDGVPDAILEKHALSYDPRWVDKYVRQSETDTIPTWDDRGNITG